MKIREFAESDAQAVADLSNANANFFQYPHVNSDFLMRMWSHPRYELFVAEDGGQIVGFCGVNFQQLPVSELGPVCVRADRRAHGLGKALVGRAMEFVRSKGPSVLIIKAKKSNIRAQEFFTSLGFRRAQEVSVGGEPAVVMEHGLDGF